MADATADRADMVRSLIIWAIALVAAILVASIVGGLFGLGAAPGLIFGAAVFVVLPVLIPLSAARPTRSAAPAAPRSRRAATRLRADGAGTGGLAAPGAGAAAPSRRRCRGAPTRRVARDQRAGARGGAAPRARRRGRWPATAASRWGTGRRRSRGRAGASPTT